MEVGASAGSGSDVGTKEIVTVYCEPDKSDTGEAITEAGTLDGILLYEITTKLGDDGRTTNYVCGTFVTYVAGTT
jgi:hypothetical protein